MRRVLAALTAAALLTLALGAPGSARPALTLALGAAFAVLATAGFAWVRRRRLLVALGYVLVQMTLGAVLFGVSDAATGATMLIMVLVSQSVLLLPLWVATLVVVLHVPLVHLGMPFAAGLREGLGTLAVAVSIAVATELLVREQRARAELARAHEQLQAHASQAERLATAQERNRIARDIHDGLGHALTTVQMQVRAARAVLGRDPVRADAVLAKAQHQSEAALVEVRRSVSVLRGPRTSLPLPEALRALVDDAATGDAPLGLAVRGEPRPLAVAAEESLYRAAQEGLTNVRKHARATRAELLLDYSSPGAVRLEVCDDGTGAAVVQDPGAGAGGGAGLLGLRERVTGSGGRVSIASTPGRGTTLRVEVPG